jgi:rhodanese-related sulfurtransferase
VQASVNHAVDDVPVEQVWARLQADPKAVLIDVRTRAEWNFVGTPDLSALSRKPVLVEWQSFPDGSLNAAFLDQLVAKLDELGADRETELFFICRSGARSRHAANAAAGADYKKCHNVAEGLRGLSTRKATSAATARGGKRQACLGHRARPATWT